MGVQVPCRVHSEVPQEVAVWENPTVLGQCIPRARPAQGMPDRGRALDPRSCAHVDINPAEVFGGRGDRVSEREELDLDCAECRTQVAQFSGPQVLGQVWARGYFVSTIVRDEEMIRAYIRNQEMADKQLDQLQLKLPSS